MILHAWRNIMTSSNHISPCKIFFTLYIDLLRERKGAICMRAWSNRSADDGST